MKHSKISSDVRQIIVLGCLLKVKIWGDEEGGVKALQEQKSVKLGIKKSVCKFSNRENIKNITQLKERGGGGVRFS